MPVTEFGDYLSITYVDNTVPKTPTNCFQTRILPFAASPLYNVEIVAAKQLTTGEDVNIVYDITLNIENIDHEFQPGDTIGILPSNNKQEVEKLFSRLNLTAVANQLYTLKILSNTTKRKAAIPLHIPESGSLRDVFLNCIDIRSVPKKLFLRSLLRYTTKPDDIELLQQICSPSGSEQYNEFVSKHKTFLCLLEAIPSCNPPVERLLENLPPLQPRPYSISSSSLSSKNNLHITFAVTHLDKDMKGLCTGWLETCIKGLIENNGKKVGLEAQFDQLYITTLSKERVPLYFRKSNNFRLPLDSSIPIVMIGPGTGVAPFVGFLEQRHLQPLIKFGASWLFYGCRYCSRDYLFKHKLHEFQESGALSKLFVCFSRESNKKQYVQDLIIENKTEFVDLICQQNAVVYVCGDEKNMVKDIQGAIVSCLMDIEKLSKDEAERYIKEMEQTNRYIKDAWL